MELRLKVYLHSVVYLHLFISNVSSPFQKKTLGWTQDANEPLVIVKIPSGKEIREMIGPFFIEF